MQVGVVKNSKIATEAGRGGGARGIKGVGSALLDAKRGVKFVSDIFSCACKD